MYEHILVTLDGSPQSESILPHVAKLFAESGARVTLLAVSSDPAPISSPPRVYKERMIDAAGGMAEVTLQEGHVHRTGETHEQAIQRVEDELLTYLEEKARPLAAQGMKTVCRVAIGDPVDVIIEQARLDGVDAIAMSSHGRSGLSQLLFGSVASKVIERAGIPVLVIRPNAPEA